MISTTAMNTAAGASRRVLIVDDDDTTRRVIEILMTSFGYGVETARDGVEGLSKLASGVDLVLLDVVMPGMDGFEVCRRIRHDPATRDVPVMIVTSTDSRGDRLSAVEAGATDFIAKPVDETELRVRSASLLKMKEAQDALKSIRANLEDLVERRSASLRRALVQMAEAQRRTYIAQLDTVERLAIVAEYKDQVTARHIQRMSEYCAVIARGLEMAAADVELVMHASRMHDVGKIAIPDAILQKPAALDPAEWEVMRQHPGIGAAILDNSPSQVLQAGRVIALHHHERWDGGGYPGGMSGEQIPLWGRICAVADVFDAVTSERPYKRAFSNDEAMRMLREGRGAHFDPHLIDVFFERADDILAVQARLRDGVAVAR